MVSHPPKPRITALASAVPAGQIESVFHDWAAGQIGDGRQRTIFARMADRAGISHRFSVLDGREGRPTAADFYASDHFPTTATRMAVFATEAPRLALDAIEGLGDLGGITHLVVASCTGFMAPGLDQVIARRLGLAPDVERVSIGFMGCYAGITALRTAGHIVRSQRQARVLVVAVELCTLHLQQTDSLEGLLAMRQFADGAAAALVCAEGPGLGLGAGISRVLEDSADLITWTLGDTGFAMHLSGAVPALLANALDDANLAPILAPDGVTSFAVHPGGRSILDAVERGLRLEADSLIVSRSVLERYGNMSSASVMFVLQDMWDQQPPDGVAIAFGPGLALEGVRFGWNAANAG
ncbi:type III polyketide synthase [Alteraurantiacibacter buctensis]|uniref:Type III polyketide synthase n=1 Tax=Alteraurantiacibacter buctensis TaxID=1503981 RepID=A0A844YWR2_9SPHN|nr:type III polyketide synthase [Alteraurantiacibacter buctensis]MXO71486.1 type III polyketide synthase [Alteraurantiacibacter buctensis]